MGPLGAGRNTTFADPRRDRATIEDMRIENGTVHWLALDGAANARVVMPGVLLRSDNLQGLTDSDIERLVADQALELVLDLRTDVEIELEGPGPIMREPRVRVEHRSLYPQTGGNTDLEAATVKPWGEITDDAFADERPVVRTYMNYLVARPDSIVAAVRAIAGARGAVLVHCAAGKDRTGVVVALALDAAGVDRAAIVGDYVATADRIEAILERLVASPTYRDELEGHDPQQHAPVPATMERVFELVDDRFGGSASWLAQHGLGAAELQQLRTRLGA